VPPFLLVAAFVFLHLVGGLTLTVSGDYLIEHSVKTTEATLSDLG